MLHDGVAKDLTLAPGNYDFSLYSPSGLRARLQSASPWVEGSGENVEFEITASLPATEIRWSIEQSARVVGEIDYENPNHPRLIPWASNLKNGQGGDVRWLNREQTRFEAFLDPGPWEIELDQRLGVVPRQIDVALVHGQETTIRFSVASDPDHCFLQVSAVDKQAADSGPLDYVEVGVWPSGSDPYRTEPLETEDADDETGIARVKVPHGRYVVGVRRSGFMDALREADAVCSEGKPESVRLMMERGAALTLQILTEEGGRPVPDVSVEIESSEMIPVLHFSGNAWDRRRPPETTDSTGRLVFNGVESGHYDLTATLPDRLARNHHLAVIDGAGTDPLDGTYLLRDGPKHFIDAVARRAATIEAALACGDGHDFDFGAEVVIISVEQGLPALLQARFVEDNIFRPVQAEADASFYLPKGDIASGPVIFGPLVEGPYIVGILPDPFDRWHWIGGGDDPRKATIFEASSNPKRERLDPVETRCEPRFEWIPEPQAGDTAMFNPELGSFEAESRLSPHSWPVDEFRTRTTRRGGSLEIAVDSFPVVADMSVTYHHPHIEGTVRQAIGRPAMKGMAVVEKLQLPPLGGALDASVPPGCSEIRLTRADGYARVLLGVENSVRVRGLPPGEYDLAACGLSHRVSIRKGQTTTLDLGGN
ncbi:hypothetical protein ABI59_12635 [Acidobacteria bacterium Mor1]|nr:hypothetical protein ABI59_12635 [Acidobacteria bacterium Mor1]